MFGEFLSTGDYDGDGRGDLVVGVPQRPGILETADAGDGFGTGMTVR